MRRVRRSKKPLVNAGFGPSVSELFHLRFTEVRRMGEGEKNHFLAGYGTDVVVHGHDLDARDPLDHRFHD